MKRRDFVSLSALTTGASLFSGFASAKNRNISSIFHEPSFSNDVPVITVEERKQRILKAQQLLKQENIRALVLDAGTSLNYFTGIRWWPSERTMVAIIPEKGDIFYICPAFEEARFREQIKIGTEVFTWEEDENPSEKIITALRSKSIQSGKIAMEEQVRFFIPNGLEKVSTDYIVVSGNPITIPCRQIKSSAEIALMQKAFDITIEAIKTGIRNLREAMSPNDISNIVAKAHQDLGANHDFALCIFGESSAFPHGTTKPQQLKKGDIVLMDCGCNYKGYSSDISRTIVFGAAPTKRQEHIWNLELTAQTAGFNAAKIGATAESVDVAARKVITDAGFGPNYKLPGLPHRTGHGIGMNGHEYPYMVRGNKTVLKEGMCFSIEPTIAIIGEFGIRLEDCVYMKNDGPHWFSEQSISINEPFKGYKVL